MPSTLVVLKSGKGRQNIDLKHGINVVGRQPDCDIRIPIMLVSRQHCKIHNDGQQLRIEDLGSSNGTYLNSEKIMEGVIQAGDKLSVGPITFLLQVDGHPEVNGQVQSEDQANGNQQIADVLGQHQHLSERSDTIPASDFLSNSDNLGQINPLSDIEL